MSLDPFLLLGDLKAYVVYRVVPRANGKTDKVPVSPITGVVCDHTDLSHWVTLTDALAAQEALGAQGVGGCLDALGLFCVDLDDALQPDGTWSPFALSVCARFPGAFMEVSHSGKGLHIFGRHREIPEHRTSKKKVVPLEVYTRKRFIALTGTGALGDPSLDFTAALTALIAEYFPTPSIEKQVEWTTAPRSEWSGPLDDDELIRRMCALKPTAQQVFAGRASAADLFYANADVLSVNYPSSKTVWDESAADQALANHLAWWTGGDCERIERIMQRSSLVRPKWEREA